MEHHYTLVDRMTFDWLLKEKQIIKGVNHKISRSKLIQL